MDESTLTSNWTRQEHMLSSYLISLSLYLSPREGRVYVGGGRSGSRRGICSGSQEEELLPNSSLSLYFLSPGLNPSSSSSSPRLLLGFFSPPPIPMEFWGLEVKPGQVVKCKPEDDHFLHLSQGALGESKKETDKATMYVKVDDKKLSIGTLSTDRFPQIQFDLVFEKEFELSHTSKTASVFFSGYKVFQPAEGDEMDFDSEGSEDEEEEENIIPVAKENGKAEGKDKEQKRLVKIDAAASKPKAVAKDVGKNKKDDDESDDDESDDSDSDDSDEGLILMEGDDADLSEEDSSEDDEESDDEEEEETPKKPVVTGKKRAAESVSKTPASDKKAKAATPSGQKTGDKKGAVHVATPHPAKKAGKTPATNEKSPKSGGSVACKSCSKTFNSEMALQSHSNAKHPSK